MTSEVARVEFTSDQIELIKRTICVGANNDELSLFLQQCKRTGLDPFAKQIYGIKRKGKLSIQIGIDGFRLIACRTGELDGQDGPFWCGADGVWRDVWVSGEPPVAAKVIVYRKGCSRGFAGVARFDEYAQYYDGRLLDMWERMGANQIAKCAEALALRKGFPQELSGLYATEEMEQADREAEPKAATQPTALPAKPAHLDPAPAERELSEAATLDALKVAWERRVQNDRTSFSKADYEHLAEVKEARKAALSPQASATPTSPEREAAPVLTAPASERRTSPALAGADIVNRCGELAHELDLTLSQIRDHAEGKAMEIALAARVGRAPEGKSSSLLADEALRLLAVLEERVRLKREKKEKREQAKAAKEEATGVTT